MTWKTVSGFNVVTDGHPNWRILLFSFFFLTKHKLSTFIYIRYYAKQNFTALAFVHCENTWKKNHDLCSKYIDTHIHVYIYIYIVYGPTVFSTNGNKYLRISFQKRFIFSFGYFDLYSQYFTKFEKKNLIHFDNFSLHAILLTNVIDINCRLFFANDIKFLDVENF